MQTHKYENCIIISGEKGMVADVIVESLGTSADKSTKNICLRVSNSYYNILEDLARKRGYITQKGTGNVGRLMSELLLQWYSAMQWEEFDNFFNIEMRLDKLITSRVDAPLREMLYMVKRLTGALEENRGEAILGNSDDLEQVIEDQEKELNEPRDEEIDNSEIDITEDVPRISINNMMVDVVGKGALPDFDNIPAEDNEKEAAGAQAKEEDGYTMGIMRNKVYKTSNDYNNRALGEIQGEKDEAMMKVIGRSVPGARQGARQSGSDERHTEAEQPKEASANKEGKSKFHESKIKIAPDGYPEIDGVARALKVGNKMMYEDGSIYMKEGEGKGSWWKLGYKVVDILKEEESL